MSAIQLLEKIGANASLRYAKNEMLSEQEIKNLIDICPDVYCIMAPAEDDDDDDDDDDDQGDDSGDDDQGDDDQGDDECEEDSEDQEPETKSVANSR
jgi:hypothetical protein